MARPTRRGHATRSGATALDLERWADSLDARGRLPQLVRRLVRATGKDLRWPTEFPALEQVQRPGWDGVVEAGSGTSFVPEGVSVWEMGVDQVPQTKANKDFDKRTADSLGLDRSRTTYVFVTPRKWTKKADWSRERAGVGGWKEVRAYDSASLEEWLEQAPAVDAWLGGILGLKPSGVTVLDEHWANLQASTDPELPPEVFLASRRGQVEELGRWLDGPAGVLVIGARSPAEAIDFVAAYGREPSRADLLAARALIVETRDAWRTTVGLAEGGLILIPSPSLSLEPELIAEAIRRGHRVLLSSPSSPREPVTTLTLPRVYRYDLEPVLRSAGLGEEQASRAARDCGGSLTVLKRLLGRHPGTFDPPWSRPPESRALAPILLAGAWDGGSEPDRAAVERLSGRPYREVSELVERWAGVADPPLALVGDRWSLVSRDDSWLLLGRDASSDDLRRFDEVALEVLAEEDPAFELPADRRWQAFFGGKKSDRHSSSLRQGLAETLALMGARPDRLARPSDVAGRAGWIVRQLLDGRGWLRWASLSAELPLLAEADPDAFLVAVEKDLKRASPAIAKLFELAGDRGPLSGPHPHTGLLRALEVLAWDPDHLPRAASILATLAGLAPNDGTGNSPGRSFLEIFMPWFPQTAAPVEDRVKVLRTTLEKQPGAGWGLLVGLLPDRSQIAMPTARPSWRDWALGRTRDVPVATYWHQVIETARLLIDRAGADVPRWKTLIDHLENLPEPVRAEFLGGLWGLAEAPVGEGDRQTISEALREKVARHRQFATSNWALPGPVLEDLDRARVRFEPNDPVRKNAWLFESTWQIYEIIDEGEGRKPRFKADRRAALLEILGACDWGGILRLAGTAGAPSEVGEALAAIGVPEHEPKIIPSLLVATEEKVAIFAQAYARRRFSEGGWPWIGGMTSEAWSADELGTLLALLPFDRETWDHVARRQPEVVDRYWRVTPALSAWESPEGAEYAVAKLLEHARPAAAIRVLGMALHRDATFDPGLIMDALEGWLKLAAGSPGQARVQADQHYLQQLFQELQGALDREQPGSDRRRLALLEWAYLDLLDGHPASPATLHGMLRDDPAAFVELLGLVFRPKGVAKEDAPELSEGDERRAKNAYQLLYRWEDIPGQRKDRTFDEEALFGWIEAARSMARERDLLEVADAQIGQVLAHAPGEPDGSWPCLPVRDALEEEVGTEDVFDGFGIGIYNKRGVHWKSPQEGGAQERTLSERYRAFAEACRIDWPHTAAELRRVAERYEEQARRADAAHD